MSDNIHVCIKIRPFISREENEKLLPQWSIQDKAIFQTDEDGHRLGDPYIFNHIFLQDMSNADVYVAVVEPLIKSFLNGFNSTIFAYGQTSSGKTYTMMGNDDVPGIIQMAITDIFNHVDRDSLRRYLISCSYFEIYNEKIYDLLDKNSQDLKIHEDHCGNTFLNAKEEVVSTQAQVLELMKLGNKIKKIGCTNMNERSSRSHTIFRFTIKSTENKIEHGPVQISQLNLVDLAGSERIAYTKAAGIHLKEGVNINKSLLALGNVIRQLSEGEGFINYRDSNLTRLLQQALGGNAKSLIIATITIAAGEETKSTLKFAQRAKVIKNTPIINEILSEQDKLKQYELVTANYKERLEKETLRILEMEHEKEGREKEISKLKQQVKLIDLFTNGPELKKAESKISRRHTLGDYTSGIPEETISESRALQLNIPEKPIGNDNTKNDFDDEELSLKTASQVSDYDYMKMVIEESLQGRILSVSPKPAEDLVSLNKILKDTIEEKENLKVALEEELDSLKYDLKYLKKKCDEFALALEQAEAENDALRLEKEYLLNDKEFLLEQQRCRYEKQVEYYINEIEYLNKLQKESETVDYDFEGEIQKLRETDFRKFDYQENIEEQGEQFKKFEIDEQVAGALSVSTEMEERLATQIQRKEAIIFELEMKIENLELINNNYLEEIKAYKIENDAKTHEIIHQADRLDHLENEIETYQKELESNANKIKEQKQVISNQQKDMNEKILELNQDLTKVQTENECCKKEIVILKNEIGLKDDEIKILKDKPKEIPETKDNLVVKLERQIEDLEQLNNYYKKELEIKEDLSKKLQMNISYKEEQENQFKEKNNKYEEEICSRDHLISDLTTKIKALQSQNSGYQTDIQFKDDQIAAHISQVKDLEENIDAYKQEVWNKDKHISELSYKIKYLEKRGEDIQNEMQIMENQVLHLINEIKNLEIVNGNIELEIQIKNEEISVLTSNIKDLENLNLNEKEMHQATDKKISDLEKSNECNVEKIKTRDNNILDLKKRIHELETVISLRDGEISQLNIAMHNFEDEIIRLKTDLQCRDDMINELSHKIDKLDRECNNYEDEISQCKEEIFLQERQIKDLTENGANKEVLQKTAQDYKKEDNIQDLNKTISNLLLDKKKAAVLMDDLMIEKETKRVRIRELDNRMRSLHIENTGLRNKIFELENLVTELKSQSFSSKLETRNTQNSNASTSSPELSPKEVRRRKRQSVQDQRRGIDLTAVTCTEDEMVEAGSYQTELTEEISSLKEEIQHLTNENESLESEIQGYIRELSDYKQYNDEKDNEIEVLKAQIDKLKSEPVRGICRECPQKERMIKKLEELQKQNKFKIVELQTKIYDLRNIQKEERSNSEDRERQMQYKIKELEKRVGDNPLPELRDNEIQCDLVNCQQLLEKYSNMKKLARMRKDEGNILRVRLGMNPDEPV